MIKIKRASIKDRDVLLLFRYLLHIFESKVERTDKFDKKVMQQDKETMLGALKNKKVFFFIAYHEDVPVGYSKVKIKKINNELMGHGGAIFVLESYRGLKIGKKLFETMANVLRKNKIKKFSIEVWKSNKLSINVHKKLGFKIMGEGSNSKLYRMERDI